jgi:hypothetical protein
MAATGALPFLKAMSHGTFIEVTFSQTSMPVEPDFIINFI